jgi:hypothetical protein
MPVQQRIGNPPPRVPSDKSKGEQQAAQTLENDRLLHGPAQSLTRRHGYRGSGPVHAALRRATGGADSLHLPTSCLFTQMRRRPA